MYQMITIYLGTRIRERHDVYANVMTSVGANVTVEGTEKWVAPTDGDQVKQGDIWLLVTYNGFTGWIAYMHMGKPLGKNLVDVTLPPPPPPTDEFIMVDVLVAGEVIFHNKYAKGTGVVVTVT
jgi:hypothetical protein